MNNIDDLLSKKERNAIYPLYQDVVDYLKSIGANEVVLFGASESGKEIYHKLKEDLIDVSYFCDNDEK